MFSQDEDVPHARPRLFAPAVLDGLGLAELAAYAQDLRAEIARVEAQATRQGSHRSAADSLFRTGPG